MTAKPCDDRKVAQLVDRVLLGAHFVERSSLMRDRWIFSKAARACPVPPAAAAPSKSQK
jgi:hypothetical protein